jgi:hypothetical protein
MVEDGDWKESKEVLRNEKEGEIFVVVMEVEGGGK